MNASRFIKLFSCVFILLSFFMFFFVTSMDAEREFYYPWSVKCQKHHNPYLRKYDLMNNFKDAEALIIGSSTSEFFLPVDIEKIFSYKTFHGFARASHTLNRYVLFSHGVKIFEKLKEVFFVADFFEFNGNSKVLFDPKIYKNPKLKKYIFPQFEKMIKVSFKDRLWRYFSHQAIERSFTQLKECISNEHFSYFNKWGNSKTTKDAVGITDQLNKDDKLENKISNDLYAKISANFNKYMGEALKDYTISEKVKILYSKMKTEALERNIKLNFIIAPYHPLFLERLRKNKKLSDSYDQWTSYIKSLKDKNVSVFHAPNINNFFGDSDFYWNDGVHFNQRASALILKNIKMMR